MDIKPMFQQDTVNFATPSVQYKNLETTKIVDSQGTIPNGIFNVIHWEKRRQLLIMILSGALALFASILIIIHSTETGSWARYILPSILLSISGYKLLSINVERTWLNRSVTRYREDLNIGIDSTPPFISKIYLELNKKQVRHNWATFFLMFYLGGLTVLLWWLKDFSWWIFTFDVWIKQWFSNPELMSWLFTSAVISAVVIYLYMTIQRKKRTLEIDAYFGTQIMKPSELTIVKQNMNKFYRRLFILSVMIILLIPMFIKIVLRLLSKK